MSVADLSRLTRLHRNTLTRTPQSPSVQARLGEVARIVSAAADIIGDDERAAVWFRHQPLAGFGGQTAAELVQANHADAVLKHLEMLADGLPA
ncbi:MAG TPA: MbcA/ParS/Xre antitoxin family protein [Caulobacteraceae bacterium]|nr:MbcA/ParS/Xre antitoxin family protein [Caulobacteraceae bacterium]